MRGSLRAQHLRGPLVLDLRGDALGQLGPGVTLDDPQREVDPRRHAARGEHVAVVDDAGLDDVRAALAQLVEGEVVRGGTAARGDPRGGEDHPARADRRDGAPARVLAREETREIAARDLGARTARAAGVPATAGHDQHAGGAGDAPVDPHARAVGALVLARAVEAREDRMQVGAERLGADLHPVLAGLHGPGEYEGAHGTRVRVDRGISGTAGMLIVPGGGWNSRSPRGARAEVARGDLPRLLAREHARGTAVASVCTGGMVLAAAGITTGRRATTHHLALDELRESGADVVDARVVDDGDVLTAGGVTSGIDLALWIVERHAGEIGRAHV